MELKSDEILDLRGICCPLNYVKAKLKLDEMKPGRILELWLDSPDGIRDVPITLKEDGHTIIEIENRDRFTVIYVKRGNS